MKKILFVSLLTGLFTTGCTLDNNTLNTVNTAMNVLGQVANNNEQAGVSKLDACKTKGWQDAYLKRITIEDGWIFHLNINGTDINNPAPVCHLGKCRAMKEGEYGTKIKVKLQTVIHDDMGEKWEDCDIIDIKR